MITNEDFSPRNLGEYIYMGMGLVNGHKVCMSVAYKIDYCVKKARQFEEASRGLVVFESINKVKVGELTRQSKISLEEYEAL